MFPRPLALVFSLETLTEDIFFSPRKALIFMSNKCLSIFPLERLGLGPGAAGHRSKVTECRAGVTMLQEPHSHGRFWAQWWLGKLWSFRELSAHLPSRILPLHFFAVGKAPVCVP